MPPILSGSRICGRHYSKVNGFGGHKSPLILKFISGRQFILKNNGGHQFFMKKSGGRQKKQHFSADKIFGTNSRFRQFCPPKMFLGGFRRTKFFAGQNFRRQAKFLAILSAEFFSGFVMTFCSVTWVCMENITF